MVLRLHLLPLRVLIVLCLSLALAAAGKSGPSPMTADPLAVAFLQAGGTLADLCDEGGRSPARNHDHLHCPDCMMPGVSALPVADPATGDRVQLIASAAQRWPDLIGLPQQHAHPGWSVRAPPLA